MVKCVVEGCKTKDKNFFRFPKDQERRRKWVEVCNLSSEYKNVNRDVRICRNHFSQDQLEGHRKDGLIKPKPNAIPDRFNNENMSHTTYKMNAKKSNSKDASSQNDGNDALSSLQMKSDNVIKESKKKLQRLHQLRYDIAAMKEQEKKLDSLLKMFKNNE